MKNDISHRNLGGVLPAKTASLFYITLYHTQLTLDIIIKYLSLL